MCFVCLKKSKLLSTEWYSITLRHLQTSAMLLSGVLSSGCEASYSSAVSTCFGSLPEALRASYIFSLMEFGWSAGCFPAKCVCVLWGLDMTTGFKLWISTLHVTVMLLVINTQHLFLGDDDTNHKWYFTHFNPVHLEVLNLWHGFPHSISILIFIHSFMKKILLGKPCVSAVLYFILRAKYDYVAFLVCFFLSHQSSEALQFGDKQRLSLIFYSRYSETFWKYLQR